MAIDTLKISENLIDAGVKQKEAKAIAEAIAETTKEKELVSKKDMQLALLRLKIELIIWQIGIALVLGGFLYAVMH